MKKRIRRVSIRGGVPLSRIHKINCLCGHSFFIDLGARNQGDKVYCSKCRSLVGQQQDAVLKNWIIS